MPHLTNEEKETIIVFNEKNKYADIFTYNKKIIQYINSKINEGEKDFLVTRKEDENGCCLFKVPKKCVKIRAKKKMTDGQKQKARERMKAMRAKQSTLKDAENT